MSLLKLAALVVPLLSKFLSFLADRLPGYTSCFLSWYYIRSLVNTFFMHCMSLQPTTHDLGQDICTHQPIHNSHAEDAQSNHVIQVVW